MEAPEQAERDCPCAEVEHLQLPFCSAWKEQLTMV